MKPRVTIARLFLATAVFAIACMFFAGGFLPAGENSAARGISGELAGEAMLLAATIVGAACGAAMLGWRGVVAGFIVSTICLVILLILSALLVYSGIFGADVSA